MKPMVERAEEKEHTAEVRGRDQFVPQRPDESLPAAQILIEQAQSREAQDPAPPFVP